MTPDMRTLIDLCEGLDVDGLKRRYRVLEPEDIRDMAERFETPEAFADHLVDSSSDAAEQARAHLMQIWADAPRGGIRIALAPVEQAVAQAIGATGAESMVRKSVPWGDLWMGGAGKLFDTPAGWVYLDAAVEGRIVYIPQIAVEHTGSGLGTATMNAIRQFAQSHGYSVATTKTTNKAFFSRFDWLEPDGGGDFRSTF